LLPQAHDGFYRPGQKTALCALADRQNLRVIVSALTGNWVDVELKLAEDAFHSPRRCAYLWPKNSGWHMVGLLSDANATVLDRKAIYIFDENQWLAQRRQERVRATLARSLTAPERMDGNKPRLVSKAPDVFLLWLILVVSATLLWLERKLDFG
jgi:hypothetical protein